MIEWNLEEVPIKELKDHPKNPRQIHKDQFDRLSKMIDKFGLIDKPIVNADKTIIGGHQRIKILKRNKVKTVACWVANEQLSDEDIDELCIGLNLHQGKFDVDILANEWDILKLLEYGFSEEYLLDCEKKSEEILGEADLDSEKKKKLKMCPACGHEF